MNIAVVKAFQRIGFKIDGRLRDHLAVADKYCDHILMSCFEYELLRNGYLVS